MLLSIEQALWESSVITDDEVAEAYKEIQQAHQHIKDAIAIIKEASMRLPWDDDSEIVETPSMQEQIKQLTEEVNTLRLIVAQLSSQMQHMLNGGNTPGIFGGHNPFTTFYGSNGAYETNAPNPYQTYAPPSLARQMFPRGES